MQIIQASFFLQVNSCTTGAVRLVGGLVGTEGTVELCHNGAWNSLCSQSWGYQEGFVVCQQLKLPATGKHSPSLICLVSNEIFSR